MFDYLQKFNNLPKELRERVSAPAVMSVMGELEGRYGIDLAVVVMKVMVKDININSLDKYFSQEFKLDSVKSISLAQEIKNGVFAGVADYLGIAKTYSAVNAAGEKAVQPIKPSSSNFFFDIEDEEEVRGLVGDDISEKKENIGADMEAKVNEIVLEADINFGSGELLERFKKILTTYVKGIRDRMETKQALIKPFDAGGMGFDNDSVEQTLKIAEIKKNLKISYSVVQPPKKISVPEDKDAVDIARLKNAGIRDVDYDFSSLANKLKKEPIAQAVNGLDTDHELAPPTPALSAVISAPTETKKEKEVMKGDKILVEIPAVKKENKPVVRNVLKELGIENSPSLTINKRTALEPAGKIKMDDIKVISRIMNPIDELRYMSLVAFRRLNSDPIIAARRIKEKIKLLEDDGYDKRLEGVKAWRESPVYKSYLEIGNKSMGENQPIDAIIENIRTGEGDCLNNQEFEAVMSLNKDLRF